MRTTVVAFAALLAAGCFENTLDPPSIVKTPRILAIVADPPEFAPGQSVTIRALVVDPLERDLEFEWSLCGRPETIGGGFDGVQYGTAMPERGCQDGTMGFAPEVTPEAEITVPGLLTQQLYDAVAMFASDALGSAFPPEALEELVERAGLPISVGVTVRTSDGTVLVRGLKRVVLSTRAVQNTNPPSPRVELGDVVIDAALTPEPFTCVTGDGSIPEVAGSSVIELAPDPNPTFLPSADDGLEPWRERYEVLDALGDYVERREGAYYSWFATGGAFEEEVTRAPARNELWTVPATAGDVSLWVVIRDGHGGTAACRAALRVP